MPSRKHQIIGLLLGTFVGGITYAWWKQSKVAKDNKETDTGLKDSEGRPIVEVTGIGGEDNGKSVKGYNLPSNIDNIKLPLTVIVKPNRNLFLIHKVGKKITFERKHSDELIYIEKEGEATGEYVIWLPDLKKSTLGA